MRKIITTFLILVLSAFSFSKAYSQIIAPSAIPSRASSQLVYWYDEFDKDPGSEDADSWIQVTNTNDSEGVWIHVQIFRSFNVTPNPLVNVLCDERDFIDFLTPNDTHVYKLFDPEENGMSIVKNIGETEGTLGEEVSIDPDDTKGFVVITPVVSESDLSAISFQHLIGNLGIGSAADNSSMATYLNAMGRDAVDFTTGEFVADNTPLDGVNNGYIVIQPEEFVFNVNYDDAVQVVGIAFRDSYGPAGLLGYQVEPAEATWTSFIFDFKEDPTSCGNKTVSCFDDIGLDEDFSQYNPLLGEELLCEGVDIPDDNGSFADESGWVRIFVSGLGDFENHLGVWANDGHDGGDWMQTKGQMTEIEPEPVAEDCSVEGDEDEDGFADCLDTDCATAEECETGAEECADTMDNDGDGQADCADLGCDGFAGCEFGTETSCNDGIDNDGDGDVDGADSDCQAADDGGTTGGDGGDGGGCTVASAVTASTAAANFLLPLLPLFGAYGIRRIRNRKK